MFLEKFVRRFVYWFSVFNINAMILRFFRKWFIRKLVSKNIFQHVEIQNSVQFCVVDNVLNENKFFKRFDDFLINDMNDIQINLCVFLYQSLENSSLYNLSFKWLIFENLQTKIMIFHARKQKFLIFVCYTHIERIVIKN